MSRNLIYLCMCTHLVRLPNQPDKFICQPCIQRQNLFQTDGSGDFGESSHSGVSGDWYSMVFYSPELHWYHKSDPEWNITFKIYRYFYLDWEKYSWTEGTKILTHSSQLKIVHDGEKYSRIWLFNPQLSNSNSQESCLPGRAQAGERVPGQGVGHLPFLSPGDYGRCQLKVVLLLWIPMFFCGTSSSLRTSHSTLRLPDLPQIDHHWTVHCPLLHRGGGCPLGHRLRPV